MNKEERIENFKKFIFGTDIPEDVIPWLDSHGYFDAPASKGHHLAEPGGLFVHSVGVTNRLLEMTNKLGLKWQRDNSPIVIGLFHDLCKMDSYTPIIETKVDFKDDCVVYGTPNIKGYEWNEHQLINGHGDKSVMLASQIMKLTEEEVICIRYHMGAFSDDSKERSAYSSAVNKYPNLLFVHTADMWSSQIDNL